MSAELQPAVETVAYSPPFSKGERSNGEVVAWRERSGEDSGERVVLVRGALSAKTSVVVVPARDCRPDDPLLALDPLRTLPLPGRCRLNWISVNPDARPFSSSILACFSCIASALIASSDVCFCSK